MEINIAERLWTRENGEQAFIHEFGDWRIVVEPVTESRIMVAYFYHKGGMIGQMIIARYDDLPKGDNEAIIRYILTNVDKVIDGFVALYSKVM